MNYEIVLSFHFLPPLGVEQIFVELSIIVTFFPDFGHLVGPKTLDQFSLVIVLAPFVRNNFQEVVKVLQILFPFLQLVHLHLISPTRFDRLIFAVKFEKIFDNFLSTFRLFEFPLKPPDLLFVNGLRDELVRPVDGFLNDVFA